ncbi:pyridoxal phosphate-dependent aminotransferase [Candidatus Aerophobetes bacterium]|uniref:Aminotransferase n=1 Tax=Aerophobetes bacterium TaxID=2030807 RepID=A0A497E148_UNCAE|nr:MAG: pyridoxal phosphate-dependent aminotransferase [Candidatus Aerophobetes bacterium]
MRFAKRIFRLKSEGAFEMLVKAQELESQGRDIIHLEIGQPDFDTPVNIKNAGKKAIDEGYTKYTAPQGLLELREEIAKLVSETRHIPVSPEEVVVTPGAKPIIFFSILACVNEGEEVLYPNPGFPIYESVINFVNAKPIPIPLLEEKDFTVDIDFLKKAMNPNVKMIILNSPHNPTGGVLTQEDLKIIGEMALEYDVIVLSDEIYSEIVYDNEFYSISSFPDMKKNTIILDGFSKFHSMTGWRLGYGVMPPELARHITKLMINSNSCAAAFTQIAGIEAIQGPQNEQKARVEKFRKRRDIIVEGLNKIKGFSCRTPKGAFYAFPNIKNLGMSSQELANYILEKAGVACLPGSCFGEFGEGYLRFSYANSVENIKRALDRIRDAVDRL